MFENVAIALFVNVKTHSHCWGGGAVNTSYSCIDHGNNTKITQICAAAIHFRKSYIISFDFIRTVWWRLSCSIGYVWRFMQLQLTPLSTLTPAQDTYRLTGLRLSGNCTVIPLMTV